MNFKLCLIFIVIVLTINIYSNSVDAYNVDKTGKDIKLTFENLSKDYDVVYEASKLSINPKDLVKIDVTNYVGNTNIELYKEIKINKTFTDFYDCKCIEHLNKSIICDACEINNTQEIIQYVKVNPYDEIITRDTKYFIRSEITKIENYAVSAWDDVVIMGEIVQGLTWYNATWGCRMGVNLTDVGCSGDLNNIVVNFFISNQTNCTWDANFTDIYVASHHGDLTDFYIDKFWSNNTDVSIFAEVDIADCSNSTYYVYWNATTPVISGEDCDGTFPDCDIGEIAFDGSTPSNDDLLSSSVWAHVTGTAADRYSNYNTLFGSALSILNVNDDASADQERYASTETTLEYFFYDDNDTTCGNDLQYRHAGLNSIGIRTGLSVVNVSCLEGAGAGCVLPFPRVIGWHQAKVVLNSNASVDYYVDYVLRSTETSQADTVSDYIYTDENKDANCNLSYEDIRSYTPPSTIPLIGFLPVEYYEEPIIPAPPSNVTNTTFTFEITDAFYVGTCLNNDTLLIEWNVSSNYEFQLIPCPYGCYEDMSSHGDACANPDYFIYATIILIVLFAIIVIGIFKGW